MKKQCITYLFSALLCVASCFTSTASVKAEEDTAGTNEIVLADAQLSSYAYSDSSSSNGVTLKVEWNDPVVGQPTIFHVSAEGGSGKYLFRMDSPSYSNPDEYAYEAVADPTRGEWIQYTPECASYDYTFTMTATGTYNFRFYVMDKTAGVYYLRVSTYVQVSDPNYPSLNSIIQSAVTQCYNETDGSDYSKALWLHDWLLQQLDYDNSLNWSSAESALTRGLGTCQAYESAYSRLLTAAGIENTETRDTYDGHTWNAMKLDGEWYQVDCTWDDTKDNWYNFDSTHLYFGLTDELMALANPGHNNIYTASDYSTRSTSLKDNYFVKSGDAATWAESYKNRIQENLDDKKTNFTITADNASYPPSISGIQNGIIAYVLNQMQWSYNNTNVVLNVTGASSDFSFTVTYPSTDHVWDEGTITKPATCTESGLITYICTDCGETKTEEMNPLGHNFKDTWTIDTEPDCQHEGSKSHHCTRCEEKQDITSIPKTEHEWDTGVILKEPTYTSEGVTKYTCKKCSSTKEVPIKCLERSREDQLAIQNKDTIKDGTYTISTVLNTDYVLNVQNAYTDNCANIQLNKANYSSSQEFKVTHDSDGYVTFTNVNSGKVIDLSSAKVENNRNIQQYYSNETKAQKWIVVKSGTGYIIRSAINSDYVIDLSGANVSDNRNIQLYKDNSTKAQKWGFTPTLSKEDKLAIQNKDAIKDGVYTISTVLNTDYVLNVQNSSKNNNGNIQLNKSDYSSSQEFIVSHDSDGYVTFTNVNSGKVIDLSSAKVENNRNIQQYYSNETKAQKWIVVKSGTGYIIRSAINSDYVIDLSGANVSDNRNIQLYKDNSTKAQKWGFTPTLSKEDKLASQGTRQTSIV